LGVRKGIWPVKYLSVGSACMVICQERGADLHMAQLMPLSLASVKSRLVLSFWYWLIQAVLDKGELNGCVFVLSRHTQTVLHHNICSNNPHFILLDDAVAENYFLEMLRITTGKPAQ